MFSNKNLKNANHIVAKQYQLLPLARDEIISNLREIYIFKKMFNVKSKIL